MPEAKVLPIGHTFTDHNLPEPHEFVGVITEEYDVVKVKCSCGYDGLAYVKDDKTICPACEGRAEHHKRLTNQVVTETGKDEIAVAEMVNSAVKQALGPLMDQLMKAQQELAQAKASQAPAPTPKASQAPAPTVENSGKEKE